jgi:hypothetical protein
VPLHALLLIENIEVRPAFARDAMQRTVSFGAPFAPPSGKKTAEKTAAKAQPSRGHSAIDTGTW